MNRSDTLLLARLMKHYVIDSDAGFLMDKVFESTQVETKNLCTKVNPEFVDLIEEYAASVGSTKSQFVRDALVCYMERIDEMHQQYLGDYLSEQGEGSSNA